MVSSWKRFSIWERGCEEQVLLLIVTTNSLRYTAFINLVERVQGCRTCPRMEGRKRVFSRLNGSPNAIALFIAEAPGRHGADRCGIPLSGDQTGRNFDILLNAAGIDREAIFITNAILCNPRDETGRNAPPTGIEIRNCSTHLSESINLIQPLCVITLGVAALRALNEIEQHSFVLSRDVGQAMDWYGRKVIPLYHPGFRSRVHRSLALQIEDFKRVSRLI